MTVAFRRCVQIFLLIYMTWQVMNDRLSNFQARCGNKDHHVLVRLHGSDNESSRQLLKSGCSTVLLVSPADCSIFLGRSACTRLSSLLHPTHETGIHCYSIDLICASCIRWYCYNNVRLHIHDGRYCSNQYNVS